MSATGNNNKEKRKRGDENLDINKFANKVLQLFQNEGINQAQAAERLNISPDYLSKHLNGSKPITINFLMDLSKEFGCSIDYLLETDKNSSTEKETVTLQEIMRFIHFLVSNGYFYITDHVQNEAIGFNDAGYPVVEPVSNPCLMPDKNLFCAYIKEYRKLWMLDDMVDLKDKILRLWLSSVPNWFNMPFEDDRLKNIILNSDTTDFPRYYGEIPDLPLE